MKQRCLNKKNPEFPDYGGRGICVDDRWLQFENFLSDMGNPPNLGIGGLYLERINNEAGYSKQNCRWATVKEQQINKRRTIKVCWNGKTKPLKTWCDELGIEWKTAYGRYRRGWSPERIFSKTRWATVFLTCKGITKPLIEWAKIIGVPAARIRYLLKRGDSPEQILGRRVSGHVL